jgi:hypothetical protein
MHALFFGHLRATSLRVGLVVVWEGKVSIVAPELGRCSSIATLRRYRGDAAKKSPAPALRTRGPTYILGSPSGPREAGDGSEVE